MVECYQLSESTRLLLDSISLERKYSRMLLSKELGIFYDASLGCPEYSIEEATARLSMKADEIKLNPELIKIEDYEPADEVVEKAPVAAPKPSV